MSDDNYAKKAIYRVLGVGIIGTIIGGILFDATYGILTGVVLTFVTFLSEFVYPEEIQ